MTGNLCYVLGCYNGRATLSAQHKRFGRVATCADHHPDRGGIGIGFGNADAPAPAPAPVAQAKPAGGARVQTAVPVDPRRPSPVLPSAGIAQPAPVAPSRLAGLSTTVDRQRLAAARLAASQRATGGAL
jgi:hypothetical protein